MADSNTPAHPDKNKGYELDHLRPEVNYRPAWGELSAAFRARAGGELDVPYKSGSRGYLDFFPAPDPRDADTLIFIHGGYWHKGDKSFYSFVAEPFLEQGVSCILLNYDFCPTVRIADITAQVQAAVQWVWRNSKTLGISPHRLHVAGHSAGGHLAGMLATTDWPAFDAGLPADLLKSATLLSGLFDLDPLRAFSLNAVLKLDAPEAANQSPALRSLGAPLPQLVACGELESDEFHRQSDLYVSRFGHAAAPIERYNVEQGNHFDVINELASAGRSLFLKTLELIRSANTLGS